MRISILSTLLFACLSLSSVSAAVSMRLNTAGVIAQPTEISVDGVITPGGYQGICGVLITLKYDATKIAVTSARAGGAGWFLEGTNTLPDIPAHLTLLTNMPMQWSTGPVAYITLTPVNGPVDTSDCEVLSIWGGGCDVDAASHLATETFDTVYVTGGCGGGEAIQEEGLILDGTWDTMDSLPEPLCDPDIQGALHVLRAAGGMTTSEPWEVALYDTDSDGRLTIQDAVSVLRACPTRVANVYFTDMNSSAPPAVAPLAPGGHPVVVFTGDYSDPPSDALNSPYIGFDFAHSPFYWPDDWSDSDPFWRNYNTVWAAGWQGSAFGLQPGWPQGTRDWPTGVSIGDLDGPKVLAMNHQDWKDYFNPPDSQFPGDRTENSQNYSRLYVWGPEAESAYPWAPGPERYPWSGPGAFDPRVPTQLFSEFGVGNGHSYAAPTLYDALDTGVGQAVMASIGVPSSATRLGQVQVLDADGMALLATEPRAPEQPGPDIYSYNTWADSAFYTPPAFARPSLMARREMVAASYGGKVYRWRLGFDGLFYTAEAAPGWHPRTGTNPSPVSQTENGTVLVQPLAVADLDGDGSDEVLAATGRMYTFAQLGRVYCWNANGSVRWKYPSTTAFNTDFTSGLAVGRLRGAGQPLSVVVGDAAGKVHILHLAANGSLQSAVVVDLLHDPGFPHSPAMLNGYPFDSIVAQPVIGDVDADGVQEVVVGGYDGYVNALRADGTPVWRVAMPRYEAPDSTPVTGHADLPFPGPHLLTVTGLALSSLKNDGHLNVVVTCGALAISAAPDYVRNGQMLILDCGPDTYNVNALDWPQYQQNAQRTGFLP